MATLLARSRPGVPEPLFEFQRGRKLIACELRYHGEYGFEAAFLDAGELFYSRLFETRDMAARWADIERAAMQNLCGSPSMPTIPFTAPEPGSRQHPS